MLDSRQYLVISHILEKKSVFSYDNNWILNFDIGESEDNEIKPEYTAFLEPVVPFVTAAWMRISPFEGTRTIEEFPFGKTRLLADLLNGPGAEWVKTVNVFWAFIVLSGVWILSVAVFESISGKKNKKEYLFSFLTTLGIFVFLYNTKYMDRLLSEVPAMGLLAWTSYFALMAWKKSDVVSFALLGISWGILSLTKAVFFYLSPFFIFLFFLGMVISEKKISGTVFKYALVYLLFFCISVAPWMVRNHIRLGFWGICDRGGEQLMFRALKNEFVQKNLSGAIYVWTPPEFRPAAGKILGFSEKDMQKGGILAPLNREKSDFNESENKYIQNGDIEGTISLYNKLWATKVKEKKKLYDENELAFQAGRYGDIKTDNKISLLVDEKLKSVSIEKILKDPFGHIVSTIPFLYRGIWGITGIGRMGPVITLKPINTPDGFTAVETEKNKVKNLFYLVSFIFIVFANGFVFLYGVFKKGDLAIFILPSFLAIGVMALFSNNLPRYNLPVFPVILVSFAAFVLLFINSVFPVRETAGEYRQKVD